MSRLGKMGAFHRFIPAIPTQRISVICEFLYQYPDTTVRCMNNNGSKSRLIGVQVKSLFLDWARWERTYRIESLERHLSPHSTSDNCTWIIVQAPGARDKRDSEFESKV